MTRNSYTLGIDFGTTSLSLVLVNTHTRVVAKQLSSVHNAYIRFGETWRREQDISILEKCLFASLEEMMLLTEGNIVAIGLTGQQHGIIGLDSKGKAITNLVTWQDKSGDQLTSADVPIIDEIRSKKSGMNVSNGYGIVTLYKWIHIDHIKNLSSFCTVPDYFGMLLTSSFSPTIDTTMAHSIGAFDIQTLDWDYTFIAALNIPASLFPEVIYGDTIRGKITHNELFKLKFNHEINVYTAIGDNQASYLGSVSTISNSLLINVGTGAQLCYAIEKRYFNEYFKKVDNLDSEIRPLNGNYYLLSCNFTCGGAVFKNLHNFFMLCGKELFHLKEDEISEVLWERMNSITFGNINEEPLEITPTFDGLRSNQAKRGTIIGISYTNLTPTHFIYHTLKGLAMLFKSYFTDRELETIKNIYGSGNGIKKNKLFQEILNEVFCTRLILTPYNEEAAMGAALMAIADLNAIGDIQEGGNPT